MIGGGGKKKAHRDIWETATLKPKSEPDVEK